MEGIQEMIMKTKRLIFREMTKEDFQPLCKILQDENVMCSGME